MNNFPPVVWNKKNNIVKILDQRYIPDKIVYRQCRNYHQVAKCIRDMVVRGAPAIGVTTAYGIAQAVKCRLFPTVNEFIAYLTQVGETLIQTRPTAVNIYWAVNRITTVVKHNLNLSIPKLRQIVINEAEKIFNENLLMDRKIAHYGVTLFGKLPFVPPLLKVEDSPGRKDAGVFKPRKFNVLTHCNTGPLATAGYGTALGVIIALHRKNKVNRVYVDETRPYLQGARLTVWELHNAKVPATLVCDNMAGFLMHTGKIDAAIVGADRIAANGDTANKIGTYSVAVLAKENKVPFYVAAPSSSIDMSIPTGEQIQIETRPSDEVRYVKGQCITLPETDVYNPAFDVTPYKYITAIITEKGIFHPQKSKL